MRLLYPSFVARRDSHSDHTMKTDSQEEITGWLIAWGDGDETALEKLMPIVHQRLRRLAHNYMRGEAPGHILQTTALVNEAYLQLIDLKRIRWRNRAQFFGISAQLMRRILVDFARNHKRGKRSGNLLRVELLEATAVAQPRGTDFIALDEALTKLAALDPRQASIVEMRFFAGLNEEEIAEAVGLSPATVRKDWSLAKAWLYGQLCPGDKNGRGTISANPADLSHGN